MIKDNLEEVRSRVKLATLRAGRKEEDVTLIAVSKTKPVEMLKEVYDLGVRDFGENKVQELVSKYEELPADIRWHMIGHLQTNKVKYIVDKAYMIHSVDSYKLAKEISKEAVKINKVVKILIEVNVAAEESKFGSNVEETLSLVEDISKLPGICIKGLMTVAPFVENPEENRKIFEKLQHLAVDINSKKLDNVYMDCLSMGMSGDFEIAIEEGASYVRVGTSIFGERIYNLV